MAEDFYQPPGVKFEPGDIFLDIPLPSLKHTLEFFRPSPKDPKSAAFFTPEDNVSPKDGDTIRGSFQKTSMILLLHGCDLDGVIRDVEAQRTNLGRRHWLAAPIRELSVITSDKMKQRTKDGTQPNKFYLPFDELFGNEESFVDLRKITPITVPYFLEAASVGKRVVSFTNTARAALHA